MSPVVESRENLPPSLPLSIQYCNSVISLESASLTTTRPTVVPVILLYINLTYYIQYICLYLWQRFLAGGMTEMVGRIQDCCH